MHIAAQFTVQTINMLSILLYEALCNTVFCFKKKSVVQRAFIAAAIALLMGWTCLSITLHNAAIGRGQTLSTQSRVGKARRLAPVHVATQPDGMRDLIRIFSRIFS